MALVCFAEIKSRIKGHPVYDYKYLLKEELECLREPTNRFRKYSAPQAGQELDCLCNNLQQKDTKEGVFPATFHTEN